MRSFSRRKLLSAAILVLAAIVSVSPAIGASIVLSDNTSNTNSGTEVASGTTWLASSFGTGSSSYTLSSVSLLLQETGAGSAEVAVYSDGGEQPGTLVGVLTSPASYSSSLVSTSFTAHGITLASNSTYWVVLEALSGTFQWGWTSLDTGNGIGFQDAWAQSFDSGADWFYFNSSPTQMTVTVTALSSVPEPGSVVMLGTGLTGCLLAHRRFHRNQRRRRSVE